MFQVPDDVALTVETVAARDYEARHSYWASLSSESLQDRRSEILAWLTTFTPERFAATLTNDEHAKPLLQRLVELSIVTRVLSGQGPALR